MVDTEAFMASLNKVLILGNLGNDPEKKEFPSGQSVVRFSVATNESWFDKTAGTRQERTEWHKVVVFGRLGDQCMQFLKKGRTVFVEGRLQTSSWEDKQSGQKRFMTEVIANTVEFIGGQGQGQGQGQGPDGGHSFDAPMAEPVGRDNPPPAAISDDDVPF
jgi:single-strand DNA-binding protein